MYHLSTLSQLFSPQSLYKAINLCYHAYNANRRSCLCSSKGPGNKWPTHYVHNIGDDQLNMQPKNQWIGVTSECFSRWLGFLCALIKTGVHWVFRCALAWTKCKNEVPTTCGYYRFPWHISQQQKFVKLTLVLWPNFDLDNYNIFFLFLT